MNTERLAGLLGCPFCGGEACLKTGTSSTVQCVNDQCIIGDPAPFNDFSHRYDAVTAWNTRAPDESLLSRLAALEEALKPFADACTRNPYGDEEVINDCLSATLITHGDLRRARATLAQAVAGEGRDDG